MKSLHLRKIAKAYSLSISFWFGMSLLMGSQYGVFNLQNLWASFSSLVINAGAHAIPSALWTPAIFYLAGKYLNFSRRRIRYVMLWVLGAVPFVLIQTAVLWAVIPAYDEASRPGPHSIEAWLELIRTGFADHTFIYLSIVVAAHAYQYFKRVRREETERYKYQQALAASELQALKMQLHPHFLFNTLNGITSLIDDDPKNAKAMIIKLSSLLRTALDRDSSDLIPLERELRFVREYLDLEKMRFGSRLKIEWRVAPETNRLLVPQMILQPLVENAIRHGVDSALEGGWVEVAASALDGILNIHVRNSMGDKTRNGTGVGLRNAEARLRFLYGRDASLHLSFAEDCTATVSLILPILNSQFAGAPVHRVQNVREGKNPLCAFSSSTTNP